MTAKDQLKLLKQGFMIIRKEETRLIIKAKSPTQTEWAVLRKGYKTKAALNRDMAELLKLDFTIED
jgi:hypothetical protein